MGFFAGEGVGIDLGSANTTIYLENEGIVLREPTSVLTLRGDTGTILAVGGDAYALMGRSAEDVELISPIMDGAVTDAELAALTMVALSEKATGRRKPLEKAQLLVSMSQGLTKVEKDALKQAVRLSGVKRSALIKTPFAAAVGAGLDVEKSRGSMVVVLGAGTTEIAVISMGAIVAARSMRTGALSMDEAIVRYVRRKKGLLIGLGTAEDLKCDIGSAVLPTEDFDEADEEDFYGDAEDAAGEQTEDAEEESEKDEPAEGEKVTLKGRDLKTGIPRAVQISTREIALSLREPVRILADAMRDAIGRTPPELAGDLLEAGVQLSGGGALLSGLAELLTEKCGVPFHLSEHPHEDVILGIGMLAGNQKLLDAAFEGGSAEE